MAGDALLDDLIGLVKLRLLISILRKGLETLKI